MKKLALFFVCSLVAGDDSSLLLARARQSRPYSLTRMLVAQPEEIAQMSQDVQNCFSAAQDVVCSCCNHCFPTQLERRHVLQASLVAGGALGFFAVVFGGTFCIFGGSKSLGSVIAASGCVAASTSAQEAVDRGFLTS